MAAVDLTGAHNNDEIIVIEDMSVAAPTVAVFETRENAHVTDIEGRIFVNKLFVAEGNIALVC